MIRVGLVGFGMGSRVFHGPLISSVEGLELAAVVERHTNKAAERYPGIITYRTLEELLADHSIPLVVIVTPSGSHFELAKRALEAGKHLVVDKPMCARSGEILELIEIAERKGLLLVPFHSRRWDGDYRTLQRLLQDKAVGRVVSFASYYDRWRPQPKPGAWKEVAQTGSGILLDLGTHLIDQALELFGLPVEVGAEVLREREPLDGADDSFTVRLYYDGMIATVGGNNLSEPSRARYHLRGMGGNYWKFGMDSQEARLNQITRIVGEDWGGEDESKWGRLYTELDGTIASRPVEAERGDYRLFYAGVRDALLGKGEAPVKAEAAWRVARVIEWARESAQERRVVRCVWNP
jgi:predicted dehydrogenase